MSVLFDILKSVTSLAGYLHDIGKATEQFQSFLRETVETDEIRHEYVSYYIVRQMAEREGIISDSIFLENLINLTPQNLYQFQEEGCKKLLKDVQMKKNPARVRLDMEATPGTIILHAVLFLVVSHHKMPAYSDKAYRPFCRDYLKQVPGHAQREALEFLDGDSSWLLIRQVANTLRQMEVPPDILGSHCASGLPGLLEYGRVALRCSDRYISSQSPLYPPSNITSDDVFANSNLTDTGAYVLRQPLHVHLHLIGEETWRAYELFDDIVDDLPYTDFEKPLSSGPFAWQGDAHEKIQRIREETCGETGFIGFVTAPTGTGKTLGNFVIMNALRPYGFRATVAIGLRALTMQTGKELSRHIDGTYVNMGCELSMALYQHNETLESDILPASQKDDALPYIPCDYQDYMKAPVCVTTIDSLMTYGKRDHMAMRLMSSDLIIDEFDGYDIVDQGLIVSLVKMAAVYGRKVIISSATLSLNAMEILATAYHIGYREYAALNDAENKVIVGSFGSICRCETANDISDIKRVLSHAVEESIRYIEHEKVVRKAGFIKPESTDFQCVVAAIKDGCWQMHRDNHLVDPVTGKRFSIGLLRFPHIQDVIEMSHALGDEPDTAILVYHSRTMPVLRYATERWLDVACCRKDGNDIFRIPEIRKLINRSRGDDIALWVVASPVEEIGRDHDFDWMVSSVSGTTSLVQGAGRVRRHRQKETHSPNVLLLNKPISYYRKIWNERKITAMTRFFYGPGVETSLCDFLEDRLPDYTLGTPDIFTLLETDALSKKIDSRVCLVSPGANRSPMADMEHRKIKDVLRIVGLQSITDYRFTNFREQFQFRGDDKTETIWKQKDGSWTTLKPSKEKIPVASLDIPSFLQVDMEKEISRMRKDLFSDMAEADARKLLTAIDIRTYGLPVTALKLVFSPCYGMDVQS